MSYCLNFKHHKIMYFFLKLNHVSGKEYMVPGSMSLHEFSCYILLLMMLLLLLLLLLFITRFPAFSPSVGKRTYFLVCQGSYETVLSQEMI